MKDSPNVFYLVLIIAALNVLGYISTKDWNALTILLLAAAATYTLTESRVLALVVGVVGAILFRASGVIQEGANGGKNYRDQKEQRQDERKKEYKSVSFKDMFD
jgi:hypothetical protein